MHFIKTKLFFLLVLLNSIYGFGQGIQFANKVYEYMPAPGQFINTPFGIPSASHSIIGEMSGGISLGAYGGYIVLGFEKPIENDSNNPYGIDFTIFGNANQSSSEPAVVYVMRDENDNGVPDDTWFLLAGSDYWFSSTVRNYEITYFNPGETVAKNVAWEDNQGNTGFIIADTNFHTQTYYPLNDSFPEIPADKYVLKGAKINDRLDHTLLDYITSKPIPFGCSDNLPRNSNYEGWEPDNPYTKAIEGTGADGFDISWAVDVDGNYIELSQIDFIKIQTGVYAMAGWLGEISTEVTGIVDVEPNSNISGEDKLLVIEPTDASLNIGESIGFSAFAFTQGRLRKNESIKWTSSDYEVAIVNESGVIKALNEGYCYIKAHWELHPEISDSIKVKIYAPNAVSDFGENDLKLYPNPVNEVLFLSENIGFNRFTIYDLSGKRLIQSNFSGKKIMLENLQHGVYFIEFVGEGFRVSKKIIKN